MTDFLIIGGGIAGVSAAARLSHLGSVVLLEAEPALAHHASGRSAALYEPRYGLAPVVELSLASGDYFRSTPNILSPRGMMILGKAGEEVGWHCSNCCIQRSYSVIIELAREGNFIFSCGKLFLQR